MISWDHSTDDTGRCPSETYGLRARPGDSAPPNRPSPSDLRRWIHRLRKEASA